MRLAAAGLATLQRMGRPLMILERDGWLQFANDAAGDCLADGVLQVRSGRIEAVDPAQRERLGMALAEAAGGATMKASHFALRDKSGEKHLGVCVLPLRPTRLHPGHAPLAMVLVVLHDPQREMPSASLLRDLYGLTGAELRLMEDLGRGLALEDHARERGIRISTVRSHLSAALGKTGCRRQADLMRLIASLPRLRD